MTGYPVRWAALGLGIAVTAIYWNSLSSPFVFDDLGAVVWNESIRQFSSALFPPAGTTVSGRPIANATLAINWAVSGANVWSYHALNIAIHALAAVVLFGLVRRTLSLPWSDGRSGASGTTVAFVVAVLWALHPLQTESVTYVAQRVESLMGLWFLLTLYAFSRSAISAQPQRWQVVSVVACALGMATKESMVAAPLMVLLYDRCFVARSFRSAWGQRKIYYACLAGSWLILAWLVAGTAGRSGTAGFEGEISAWSYLLTQSAAIVHYLRLVVWPAPLVFDYGTATVDGLHEVWWQTLALAGLATATVWACWRRQPWGFAGLWFFATLAPSSSVVPVATQTMAEHRVYLALAAPIAVLVLAAAKWLGGRAVLAASLAVAVGLGLATFRRNSDYQSAERLWADAVEKHPANVRAHQNLASALIEAGRWAEGLAAAQRALALDADEPDVRALVGRALVGLNRPAEALGHYDEALARDPGKVETLNNLGMAYAALGRWTEAIERYEQVLQRDPAHAEAHNNLGNALAAIGRLPEAVRHYERAVRLRPDFADAQTNWGRALAESGRPAEAVERFEAALRLQPDPAAHANLAEALVAAGRAAEARREYERAVTLAPDSVTLRLRFGNGLLALGDADGARAQFERVLQSQPNHGEAHYNLANTLARQGNLNDAIRHYEDALRVAPELTGAHHNLAVVLMQLSRPVEAIPHFQAVVRAAPDSGEAHHTLAVALAQVGRWAEAETHEKRALQVNPDFAEAREHLGWIQQHRDR